MTVRDFCLLATMMRNFCVLGVNRILETRDADAELQSLVDCASYLNKPDRSVIVNDGLARGSLKPHWE